MFLSSSKLVDNDILGLHCEIKEESRRISIIVKNIHGRILCVLGMSARKEYSQNGKEIIKTAIVAWLIGKYRKATSIALDFDLGKNSYDLINDLNEKVIGSLPDSKKPKLHVNRVLDQDYTKGKTVLRHDEIFIGLSGGRDSTASNHILTSSGYKTTPYKIGFDVPTNNDDFQSFETEESGETYYEPFDIPLVYLAPLWDVDQSAPGGIAVGHSFDVIGFSSTQRRAPYESPLVMELFERFLQTTLNAPIRFVFPLATLSTFSVFEYIRRTSGLNKLESLNSCWNSTTSDCGYCDKCQRIKLASTGLHLKDYKYLGRML